VNEPRIITRLVDKKTRQGNLRPIHIQELEIYSKPDQRPHVVWTVILKLLLRSSRQ